MGEAAVGACAANGMGRRNATYQAVEMRQRM
jgi:hypothetical protein